MSRPQRIFLTGFSGTGKTEVAAIVAQRLGWQVIDTDTLAEAAAGRSILEIFRTEGEQRFRDLEAEALRKACSQSQAVVSTGGGVILRPENRRLMAESGFVVCLEARPETIFRRLHDRAEEEPLDRPLLAVADPLSRIRELKAARQHLYALCDWSIHTDSLTEDEVADQVVRAWETVAPSALADSGRPAAMAVATAAPSTTLHAIPSGVACLVHTSGGEYPVFIAWGALSELGLRLREAGLTRQAFLISDDAVFPRYGEQAEAAIRQADVPVASYVVPAGEASKSLATAAAIYDWLIEQRAERGHAVVALGGGMVTDLAGHVAATYARGLPLVHAPTSLLAMVDAAIGGKVAVNHPRAKNLIGAFYQPRLVLADVATLATLPPRELASGWAEVIKHAFVADEELLAFLETNVEAILRLDPEPTTEAIRRSVAIKAAFVAQDEREEGGERSLLNYGHTLGHALETATDYARFLHGEAVAVGMAAAAAISTRMSLLDAGAVERQRRLLERLGLPVRAGGVEPARVRAAMALDKKVRAKALRWVLLERIGRPVLRDDVPPALVEEALAEVLQI